MSTGQSEVECPQCEFVEADSEFDCRRLTYDVRCRRCGYTEHKGWVFDESGEACGWKAEAKFGSGALWYRGTGSNVFHWQCLWTAGAVTEAEKFLREGLAAGEVDSTVSYLTRWNEQARQIELVLGSFYL